MSAPHPTADAARDVASGAQWMAVVPVTLSGASEDILAAHACGITATNFLGIHTRPPVVN